MLRIHRKLHILRKLKYAFSFYFIIEFTMTSSSANELNKLALVAALMDEHLREDNAHLSAEIEYRINETDYYFKKMVAAYQRLEDFEAQALRLRAERDAQLAWSMTLERWLAVHLQTDEDIEAVVFNRPDPPLSDIGYDSDVTIMEDL